ncbi:apolipoprotein N-acyltransferase [Roseobacter sp. YSTF-M11]|uniref:Apolipoprotein N-acyltransferase n=1 Tax=Roseobacter insulae TaxID=2859783 RepID=A0A9X1K482_9RHOB|nr:apolipoprotein N-acyltransferase [Roseobacter insulae]MBW4710338.1 apolipoprotein N-acyltransferase [Roseobacter insulae]
MGKAAPRSDKPWAWYSGLPRLGRVAIAAFLGALAPLGQAPYDQPLVMLLVISLAFLLMRRQKRPGDAAMIGWAFGVGYFSIALIWIVQPFQVDPDRHAWMAPFALVFMSIGLALFWGGAFGLARLLSRRTWPLVLTWTAAEVLRAYLFTGFPWASPAQALVNGAAGQSLAWVGPHGVNLWLMSSAWALSFPAVYRGRIIMRLGQGALLCSAIALFYLPPSAPVSPVTAHWVRLVQPNAAQHLKWRPENTQRFFDAQLAFTAAPPPVGQPEPDLIVWSETAIPWTLETAGPALEQISQAAAGRPVALGLLRRSDRAVYNSLAVLDGAGQARQVYDKHHLVPFGEYIPFGHLAERLGLSGLADTSGIGFASGAGPRVLDFGALGLGLPLICYEAVFAHDVNGSDQRPDFLVQVTNDAWFGHSVGPQQHLAQARMRAIEQGLPLMRAANTGISAMIDPRGRVIASLPMGVAGYADAPLPAPLPATLYSRIGDTPLVIFLIVGLLGAKLHSGRSSSRLN